MIQFSSPTTEKKASTMEIRAPTIGVNLSNGRAQSPTVAALSLGIAVLSRAVEKKGSSDWTNFVQWSRVEPKRSGSEPKRSRIELDALCPKHKCSSPEPNAPPTEGERPRRFLHRSRAGAKPRRSQPRLPSNAPGRSHRDPQPADGGASSAGRTRRAKRLLNPSRCSSSAPPVPAILAAWYTTRVAL